MLVYACPDCTRDFDRPMMISVRRGHADDPIGAVEVEITQARGKA